MRTTSAVAGGLVLALSLACGGSGTSSVTSSTTPPSSDLQTSSGTTSAGTSSGIPSDATVLQSLRATSGGDTAALAIDGDPSTGWRPQGDPRDEGLLVRLEQPVDVAEVRVVPCPGADGTVEAFVDGRSFDVHPLHADPIVLSEPESSAMSLRTLFLRVATGEASAACVAEVELVPTDGGKPTKLAPPRTVSGTVTASSVLEPMDAYHPAFLFDGRLDFGWVEGAKGLGVGERVDLKLDRPVDIAKIELWNGYQRSDDHFHKNARASRISLEVDGATIPLDVADAMGSQVLALPATTKTSHVGLVIDAATAGTKYDDLVLSELRLWDAAGPLTVTTPDVEDRRTALKAQIDGTPLGDVVDHEWFSLCTPGNRLKLRSDHTFVRYATSEDWDEGDGGVDRTEAFDGAWVPGKLGGAWATVSLYGRRHRTDVEWQPYGGQDTTETVRVAGGDVKIAHAEALTADDFDRLVQALSDAGSPVADCLGGYRELLVARKGIVVQGSAITDVLVPEP